MAEYVVGSALRFPFKLWEKVFQRQNVSVQLLNRLKAELLSANAMVNDAEKNQYQNPAFKVWQDELQEVVYRLEDLIDEILTEDLQHSLEAESQTRRIRRLKLRWEWRGKEDILRETDEVLQSLLHIDKKINSLDLKESKGYDMRKSPRIPATSLVEESRVFGRDDEKEEIIRLLLSGNGRGQQLSVIRLVGMGGIGKTSLAQLVYNDDKVSSHFDLKVWACISDNFDPFSVTSTILELITSQPCDHKDLNFLQVRLRQLLSGKRFLLVLDDMWNDGDSDWEVLRAPFYDAAYGSCVIVTTRSYKVPAPAMMDSFCTYTIQPLSDVDSWYLFTTSAFGDESSSQKPLEDIGKKIVSKCRGLPLAIKTIGNILGSKRNLKEWDACLAQLSFRSKEMHNVLSTIKLSYDALPGYLRRCFAYCSIFPRGYEFEKEKLVLLWMAEGLLQLPGEKRRMEEVGDECFHELVLRSFFCQSSGRTSGYMMPDLWNDTSRFMMHDLLNDLAVSVSGEYCFTLEKNHFSRISARTRHLSLLKRDTSVMFQAIYNAKFLRTFLPLDHESCHLSSTELRNLLSKLQFLRVLSLSHYQITELPDSIRYLQHLRYVDLSHTTIKRLPKSVCTLCNLQTLKLSNCHYLTELPKTMWRLINLRHLDINGTYLSQMPNRMSKLENLGTLPYFVVGNKCGSTVRELGGLLYLRGALRISMLQNVDSVNDAAEAGLVDKRYLDELVLEWGDYAVDQVPASALLEKLVPHTNLKRLSINFYHGTKFPHWLGDYSFVNMEFLRLSECKNCLVLPPLGQLSSLKVLIIEGMIAVTTVGPDFYGKHKPFPSLETLTFEGMLEWEEWTSFEVEGGEFPCLQKLCIWRCPKLKGNLPKQASSVQLEISECPQLLSGHESESSLHNRPLYSFSMTQGAIGEVEYSLALTKGAVESTLPVTKGATESSSPLTQGTTESSLPMSHGATESSLPMTQSKVAKTLKETSKTEGMGESEEEIGLEIATTSETRGTEPEGKEFIEEDPSRSLFPDEKSSLPLTSTQGATESALPMVQGVIDSSFPMDQGGVARPLKEISETKGWGESEEETSLETERLESEQETSLEIATTSETREAKQEEKELIEEDSSRSLFLDEKFSLPLTQGATESSLLPLIEGATESSLPIAEGDVDTSLPMTQGGMGENKEEIGLEIATTSETKGTKQEENEFIEEDPSRSFFSDEKSSLPSTQGATESALPLTEGAMESSLSTVQGVIDTSFPMAQGRVAKPLEETSETEGWDETEEETSLETATTSETREAKKEEKELIEEDPSGSLFLDEKSSLPLTQVAIESSLLPLIEDATESSLPMTQVKVAWTLKETSETQGRGESEEDIGEEIGLEIAATSETKGTKQEEKEFIEEDPSQSLFSDEKSSLPSTLRATESSVPLTKGAAESSLPMAQGVVDTPLPMTQEESGKSEVETNANIETTFKANEIKLQQEESNKEDPSPLISEENSSLPVTQGDAEPSFTTTETPNNIRDEADVLTNQDGVQDLSSFESMKVSEISELMELPTWVHSLKIEGCDDLEFIPEEVMTRIPSLQHLYIINCCSLESFPEDHPRTALKILYIRDCKKLGFPPEKFELLEYLCVGSSCDSLEILSLDSFPKLKNLSIWDCANLHSLSTQKILENLTSLEALEIRDCPKLVSFPNGGLCTPNLTSLWLSNCNNLKGLPDGLDKLKSLQSMFLNKCPELKTLPKGGFPSKLSLLSITSCNNLSLEAMLNELHNLSRLEIEGECVKVESFADNFFPSNLSSLRISGLLNLKNLDQALQHLTALNTLEISCCDKLRSLPEDGFPSSLSFLCIKECSLLKSKLRNKKGKDWSKIAHISCIEIDEEVIS